MAHGGDLDELRRQYAALGFTEGSPTSLVSSPATARGASGLDELQRQYEAMGFSEAQTPDRSSIGTREESKATSRVATLDLQLSQQDSAADYSCDFPSGSSAEVSKEINKAESTDLADLQQRYLDIFPEASKDGLPSPTNIREQTPESSSTFSGANVARTVGSIDEFAFYQKFRLHMVQTFGSLAASLYEMGADPDTGRISRDQFVHVLCDRMQGYTQHEANTLFSHATNADLMDGGQGGSATYRDFGISDEEWRVLVSAKRTDQSGDRKAMPFQSGPTGGSMGIFLRNVGLKEVSCDKSPGKKPSTAGTASEGGARGSSADGSALRKGLKSEQGKRNLMRRSARNADGERVWPWQVSQATWKPSIWAEDGRGFVQEASKFVVPGRTRAQEFAFKTSQHMSNGPRHRVLNDHPERGSFGHEAQHPYTAPTRRCEMEPRACVKQVAAWWPYERTGSIPKLPVLPPTPKAQQAAKKSLSERAAEKASSAKPTSPRRPGSKSARAASKKKTAPGTPRTRSAPGSPNRSAPTTPKAELVAERLAMTLPQGIWMPGAVTAKTGSR